MKPGQTWEEEIAGTVPATKLHKRYSRRRRTKEGYPIEPRPFTYDEIKAYQSTPRIVCLLCGNDFDSLAKHLVYVHRVTVKEYKEMYGLPNKRGLSSPRASKNYAEAARKELEKNTSTHSHFTDPVLREETRKTGVVASQKQMVRPFRKEISRQHAKKAQEANRKLREERDGATQRR